MRKRYKLLLIIFISFILVIFIYNNTYEEKFLYVAIGDKLSNNFSTYNYIDYINSKLTSDNYDYKYFPNNSLTVASFKQTLMDNKNNIMYYLKRANLITICFGTYELYNYRYLDSSIIISYLEDVTWIITKIREINRSKIVFINSYKDNLSKLNNKLENYCLRNQLSYIGIKKSYYIYHNHLYLTYKGHQMLASQILKG